jgi:hypothetical protein
MPEVVCNVAVLLLAGCTGGAEKPGAPARGGAAAQPAGSAPASGSPGIVGGGSGAVAGGADPGGSAGTTPQVGGSAGLPAGGSVGSGGSSGLAGAAATSGDTPAPRPLNVLAPPAEYVHAVNDRPAAINTAVPTLMGKLIVNLDGGLYQFGLKRGFHVTAVDLPICPIHYQSREHNGNCRLEVFDGVDRDPEIEITPEQSVSGVVAANLQALQATYPEEDWGYYLNTDGSVRWSDVGFTGHSHRAQSAARFAVAVRAYRAVSRSGPRDNECGFGAAQGDYDANDPPYDPACPIESISAWLDEEPQTPIERFFGFVGKADDQYGDILFTMERMGFAGEPVNITTATAPYDGSHRFYADTGHDGFDGEIYYDALDIAWGVPPENAAWAVAQ